MVRIDFEYKGDLRTEAVHAPSGKRLITDAPTDNQGKGESFSPTDLVGAGLGSCMLTVMGIVAARHGWDMSGARASVEKHMIADPDRRIAELDVVIRMPGGLDERARKTLERAALTCPVHKTLGGRVDVPVTFHWGEDA